VVYEGQDQWDLGGKSVMLKNVLSGNHPELKKLLMRI